MKYCFLVLLCSAALTGCNSTPKHTQSGFLTSYDQLEASKEYPDARIYVSPTFDKARFGNLDNVYIYPFEIWLKPEALTFLGSQQMPLATAYFHQQLRAKLGVHYTIVEAMEENTLGIRGAFTNVSLTSPGMSPTDVLPFKVVMNAGNLAYLEATGQQDLVTEAGIEVEFTLDTEDNVVFAMTSVKQLDLTVDKGMEGNVQALKNVIDIWVDNFVTALEKARARNR